MALGMAMTAVESSSLADLVVILSLAALVASIAQRFRMAVIPAYLVAGAIIGPGALGLVTEPKSLAVVLELALILLLFGIGLELPLTVLRRSFTHLLLAGGLAVVGATLVGWPIAMAFGLSAPAALAVSQALSLSSTAVVLRLLSRRRELLWPHGRLSFSILVVQDLAVLGMLAVLPWLGHWHSGEPFLSNHDGNLYTHPGIRIAGALALVVCARALLPRLMAETSRGRSVEILMIVGVAAALGTAVLAQVLGFSLEMGAFLSGVILAGTPFRHQLHGQIQPLRDLFIALFFTSIGMRLEWQAVAPHLDVVALAVVTLIVAKFAVLSLTSWAAGAAASVALTAALSLAQSGEFSLILLTASHQAGLLTRVQSSILMAVVVMSLVLTPALAALGVRCGRRFRHWGTAPWIHRPRFGPPRDADGVLEEERRHVLVAGFGPIGREVVRELEEAGLTYTVLELNARTVREEKAAGRSIVFGSAANPEVLHSAGIERADAIVLTMPDEDAVLRSCLEAKRRAPDLFVAARVTTVRGGEAVRGAGADHVIVDELATARDLTESVRDRLRTDLSGMVDPLEVVEDIEGTPSTEPGVVAAPDNS